MTTEPSRTIRPIAEDGSLLERVARPEASAPYIAGAVLTAATVLVSFVGHRHYSFARDKSTDLP